MSLDFGLKDTQVLITGAAGGIGLDITRTFLELGAKVTAHYNSSPKELTDLEKSNPDGGDGQLKLVQADVRSEDDVSRLFDDAERAHHDGKPVQVLIVNHAVWPTQSVDVADMSLAQWRNTHAVNLDGAFLLCREFLRRLRHHYSTTTSTTTTTEQAQSTSTTTATTTSPVVDENICIIFIGSTAGKFGEASHADYASTKSSLMNGLMLSLKNEIIRIVPRGRVNCVSPGWVRTKMVESVLSDEGVVRRALATTPLAKVARTVDVARQVVVLASPVLSGHVSGVNVMVDGGMEGRCLFWPGDADGK